MVKRPNMRKPCPHCGPDKKPSLSIEIYSGVYHCFRCGMKGKIKGMAPTVGYKHLLGEPRSSKVAVEFLPLPEGYEKIDPYKTETLPEKVALKYLLSRGMREQEILKFQIGYTIEGVYKDRVIIPCFEKGHLVYFVARTFKPTQPRKYLNPPVPKGDLVFRTYHGKAPRVCVVEGVFDAIQVSLVAPAIALLSKKATKNQLQTISKYASSALIMLDADAPADSVRLFDEISHYIPCRIAHLDKGDPATTSRRELEELWKRTA